MAIYMNGTEMEAKPEAHTHDTGDITDFPSTMPPSAHDHTVSDITDFPSTMPPSSHDHEISDVNGLQTALDDKFDKTGGTITGDVSIEGVQEIIAKYPSLDLVELDDDDALMPIKVRLVNDAGKFSLFLRDANDDTGLATVFRVDYSSSTAIPLLDASPSGWTLESMASSADAIATKEYVDDMSPILILTYDGVNDTVIHSKGNFGSVTKTDTGIYDVAFSAALPDEFYTASVTGGRSNNSHNTGFLDYYTTVPTADGFTVKLLGADDNGKDGIFSVLVYR